MDKRTRLSTAILAILWVMLLVTAAGLEANTWFLLAVGGVGIVQNVAVAGWRRLPSALGVHLNFVKVIVNRETMQALFAVEEEYPSAGRSMLAAFFPGDLTADEDQRWERYKMKAQVEKAEEEAAQQAKIQSKVLMTGAAK